MAGLRSSTGINRVLHRGGAALSTLLIAATMTITARATVAAAASDVITQCTEAGVRAAVDAGGTYVLGCSATIPLTSPLTVPEGRSVSIDGSGETVVLDGQGLTQLFVVTGGTLNLSALTLTNGFAIGAPATAGVNGTNGAAGADGITGADFNGTNGQLGFAGTAGQTGGNGGDGQGGAIEVRSGTVQITGVTISASTANGATGGNGGNGGAGGNGGRGGSGAINSNVPVGQNPYAGYGGNGAAGRAGAPGAAGGTGGRALGGAIYNAGTLTVLDSTLTGDGALGGPGGLGGYGGPGGNGGSGGLGTGYGPIFAGGAGGNGANGAAASDAGAGGAGGDGLGGAIYNDTGSQLTLVNSTLSEDTAVGGDGGFAQPGGGGGNGGNGGTTGNNADAKLGNAGSGANGGSGGNAGAGGSSCGGALNTEQSPATAHLLTTTDNTVEAGTAGRAGTAGPGGLAGYYSFYIGDPAASGQPGTPGTSGNAGLGSTAGSADEPDVCGTVGNAVPMIAGFALASADGNFVQNPYQSGFVAPVVWDQAHPRNPDENPITTDPNAVVGETLQSYDDATGDAPVSLDAQNGCPRSRGETWRSCSNGAGQPMGPGSATLAWPVVTAKGSDVGVSRAQVWIPAQFAATNVYLAGDITIGKKTITSALASTNTFTAPASYSGQLVDVGEVDFTDGGAALTRKAGLVNLSITWCIESTLAPCSGTGQGQINLGTTKSPVYVVSHSTFAPVSGRGVTPYLTMVDLAVNGVRFSPNSDVPAFDSIFAKFKTLAVSRVRLDPQSGATSAESPALQYYPPDWSFEKDFVTGAYDRGRTCRGGDPGADLLQAGINNCGEWAQFFSEVAAIDGIVSRPFGLGEVGLNATNLYMLVGKQAWNGGKLVVGTSNTFVTDGTTFTWQNQGLVYSGAMGQGPNLMTPGYFMAGDHALVSFNGSVYDPSYGTGPFKATAKCKAVGCWAKKSLAGVASLKSNPAVTDGYVFKVEQIAAWTNWNAAPPTP